MHLLKKEIISVVIGLVLLSGGQAQIPVSSHFFTLPNINNPAVAAFSDDRIASINYRNQWPDLESHYMTYNAAYLHHMYKYCNGIGFKVSNDVQGAGLINTTKVAASFSQRVMITNELALNAGIGAHFTQYSIQRDKLRLFAEEPINNASYSFCNLSTGIMASYKQRTFVGCAINDILNPVSVQNAQMLNSSRVYSIHIGNVIKKERYGRKKEILEFEQQVMAEFQSGFNNLSYGCFIKNNYVIIGGWLRQSYKFSIESFIIEAGISVKGVDVLYSYDLHMPSSRINMSSSGAHEITCLFKFKPNKRIISKCLKF